jgi:hypothetical protein
MLGTCTSVASLGLFNVFFFYFFSNTVQVQALTYPYKHIFISRIYKLHLASLITHCPIVITDIHNQKKSRLLPLQNIWIFRPQETSNFLINILWLWRFHKNPIWHPHESWICVSNGNQKYRRTFSIFLLYSSILFFLEHCGKLVIALVRWIRW